MYKDEDEDDCSAYYNRPQNDTQLTVYTPFWSKYVYTLYTFADDSRSMKDRINNIWTVVKKKGNRFLILQTKKRHRTIYSFVKEKPLSTYIFFNEVVIGTSKSKFKLKWKEKEYNVRSHGKKNKIYLLVKHEYHNS